MHTHLYIYITFYLLKVDILLYPGHSSKPDDDKMKNIHIQKNDQKCLSLQPKDLIHFTSCVLQNSLSNKQNGQISKVFKIKLQE